MTAPTWRDVRAFVQELPDLVARLERGAALPARWRSLLAASPRCRALLGRAHAVAVTLTAPRSLPRGIDDGALLESVYERAGEVSRRRVESVLTEGLAPRRACPPDVGAAHDAAPAEPVARVLHSVLRPVQAPAELWERVSAARRAEAHRHRFRVLQPAVIAGLAAVALLAVGLHFAMGSAPQNSGTHRPVASVHGGTESVEFTYRIVEQPALPGASVARTMARIAGR